MVKKYLVWPIRLFLYFIAILIVSFYSFCLFLTTDYGSKQTSSMLFGESFDFKDISIEPSLLGMRVEIDDFSFRGAANFSGENIILEINFLNSLIGNLIYIPELQLTNSEVKLNEASSDESSNQPNVYIRELSLTRFKAGITEFRNLELNDFLLVEDEIGFAFNNLSIELPGSIQSLEQFSGRGYFSSGKLNINLDSKEGLIDFAFYDSSRTFENLEGIIEIDFNNGFKIPFAQLSSSTQNKSINTSFQYDESFQLELWMRGNDSDLTSLIPITADETKLFLEESEFESSEMDVLLSLTDVDDISNFNAIIKAKDFALNISDLDIKSSSANLYLDNSSLRIFGDGLYVSNVDLGQFFLSKKIIDDSNYSLVLNDYDSFAIEFSNEGSLESIEGSIQTDSESLYKISFNKDRLLVNLDELYLEFNVLDAYEIINGSFRVFPKEFNSNYFALNDTSISSFDFDFNNMELNNLNAGFSLLNNEENKMLNSNFEFSQLDFTLENSYIKFQNSKIDYGGLVNISGESISYTDSTFSIDALRVLSLIDIRSRLVNILNADFEKLDQNNFFINSLSGEFFADSAGYANINNLNLNFDVGNATLAGTISSAKESFDTFNLEMIFNSTLSQNIPWYVAILGGFPAAAGAVVVTEVLEDGINQITETKYGITGNAENLVVETKQ